MKKVLVALGIMLILNSCQLATDLPEIQLEGSWRWTSNGGDFPFFGGIPINYQEIYFSGDKISSFNLVQGNSFKPWQIHKKTVFIDGVEIESIKLINEKRLLFIHQEGVDTLTFIDDLIVPHNTFDHKNKSAFQLFMKGFEQRMEKYYLETLGIDITKLPSSDFRPADEIIFNLSTEDNIEKDKRN